MNDRTGDLARFYGLMAEIEQTCSGKRTLTGCNGRMQWPHRGLYFFFEPGEIRSHHDAARIVRVGTHALRQSKSTLWGRLSQHKGNTGGSLPGGGNHRGSIFRLHVGTALLASGEWPEDIRRTWGRGSSAPSSVRHVEHPLECAVSEYIGSMPFLWLDVDDPPAANSNRGVIEAGAVALLSNVGKPAIDPPSNAWLGHHANREAVRRSGLWNVDHVRSIYTPSFLDVLELHVVGGRRRTAAVGSPFR